jgi:hypothetical protein
LGFAADSRRVFGGVARTVLSEATGEDLVGRPCVDGVGGDLDFEHAIREVRAHTTLRKAAAARAVDEGTTLTALLADGLRLRLARRVPPASARRPLPTSRNRGGMQPWIDPGSNASLLDAADDDSAAA